MMQAIDSARVQSLPEWHSACPDGFAELLVPELAGLREAHLQNNFCYQLVLLTR